MDEEGALSGGGDEDGGVGDGRGVVSEDAAAETGGERDLEVLGVGSRADLDDDGDEDAEGAPGSAHAEGERHADEEDDGGDELRGDA